MQKKFITLKLSDIHPYPNNPRINDTAVDDVIESIKQCGNCDPIEIDEDNIILSGHTRLKALQKLGYTETECVRYTGMTEEQKKKYRLLANKTGEKADWDIDLLEEELKGLDFGDFDFGFASDIILESEIDGGEVEDKSKSRVAVKMVFKDAQSWHKLENKVRDFVDTLDDVSVSVGEYDESE